MKDPFIRKRTVFSYAVLLFCWLNPSRVFFFRDLVILTKFCQTRSIGSPDAFFQFPLKCFQQRLPFLLIKENTLHLMERFEKEKNCQKREKNIHFGKAQTPPLPKCCKFTEIKKKWHLSPIKVLLFHKDPNEDLILDFLQNFLCQAALSIQFKRNLSGLLSCYISVSRVDQRGP